MRDGCATQILHMVPLPGHIVVPVGTSRQMVSEQWEHDRLRQEDDGSTGEDGMAGTMRGSMAPIICVRPERWEVGWEARVKRSRQTSYPKANTD